MTYRLLSAANAELAAAAEWNESQEIGLGQQFLDEFELVMERIVLHPEAWLAVSRNHRRCLFRRFPYAVVYSMTATMVQVAAIADLRRDPKRLQDRIKGS